MGGKAWVKMAEDRKKSLYSTCLIPRPLDFWPLALTRPWDQGQRIKTG